MTQWHHCKVYFHYWMLQVHTQKSLQSQAANHIYLAQHCPAAGVGKQTGRQMGKALTGHCTLPPPALDAVCIRADVSYLTQRPFCHYHGVCVCEVFKDVERARYLCALQQKIISLGKLRRGFHLTFLTEGRISSLIWMVLSFRRTFIDGYLNLAQRAS